MSDEPAHKCGYPKSRRGGGPCQQPVDRPWLRCPDHPRTLDEIRERLVDERPEGCADTNAGP